MINRIILILTLAGLFSCGIKGRPLPPENSSVNLNQLQQTQQSAPQETPAAPAKTTDSKKTTTKTRKK